jgi:transposase
LQFVPVVVDVAPLLFAAQRNAPPCEAELGAGMIEDEIDGGTVRVGRGADARTLIAVLRALKTDT